NKGISLVGLLRVPHFLREAVMTKLLTAFDTSIKPPLIAAMDDITYPEGVPEISREKNAVSPVKMNRQEIQPLPRSEEHTSELQSRENLVCRLLLEKKKKRQCRQREAQGRSRVYDSSP